MKIRAFNIIGTLALGISLLSSRAATVPNSYVTNQQAAADRAVQTNGLFPILIDVKTFGAVGNNIADDTAAVKRGIDFVSLSNGTPSELYISPGIYKITDTLVLRSNGIATTDTRRGYSIRGVLGQSFFNYTKTNGACVEFRHFQGDAGLLNHFVIKDVTIQGLGGTNNWSTGIYLGDDPSVPDSPNAAGYDDRVEGCKVEGFMQGVYIDNIVEPKVWQQCELESNWWASALFTNADTWLVRDSLLGVSGTVTTNLAAIAAYGGAGGRVEGCEIGHCQRALFASGAPGTWIAGNNEVETEFAFVDGASAAWSFMGMRLANIGDGTTNTTIFEFNDASFNRSSVTTPEFIGANGTRMITVKDDTFAYKQPFLVLDVEGQAPAAYIHLGSTTYFPLTNNLVTPFASPGTWTRDVPPSAPDFSSSTSPSFSPVPVVVLSATLCASNSTAYIGTKIPSGLGYTKVRSTIVFQGDTGQPDLHFFLNPNLLRYQTSGNATDQGGQAYGVTASAGSTTTLVITNTYANDTDPRELFIRLFNDGILTQAITNKVWIDKWQVDFLP